MERFLIRVFFTFANGRDECYFANLDLVANTGRGGSWFIHNKDYAFRFPTEDAARVVCELLSKGERPLNSENEFELVDDVRSKVIGIYRFINEEKKKARG